MISIWDYHVYVELMRIRSQSDQPYQVGCAISTKDNLIVARGYNTEVSEDFQWVGNYAIMKDARAYPGYDTIYESEIIHAEAMAIARLSEHASGCTMYCTLEPCVPCAEYVINSGQIVEFRYLWDYARERKHKAHLFESGVPLLEKAGIKVGRIKKW